MKRIWKNIKSGGRFWEGVIVIVVMIIFVIFFETQISYATDPRYAADPRLADIYWNRILISFFVVYFLVVAIVLLFKKYRKGKKDE